MARKADPNRGMSWFRVNVGAWRDGNVQDFCDTLGSPTAWAYVIALWDWFAQYQPTGTAADTPDRHVERALDWRGAPGELIAALVKHKQVARCERGLRVVGWERHNGPLFRKMKDDRTRHTSNNSTEESRNKDGGMTDRPPSLQHSAPPRTYGPTDGRNETDLTDTPTPPPHTDADAPSASEPTDDGRTEATTEHSPAVPSIGGGGSVGSRSVARTTVAGDRFGESVHGRPPQDPSAGGTPVVAGPQPGAAKPKVSPSVWDANLGTMIPPEVSQVFIRWRDLYSPGAKFVLDTGPKGVEQVVRRAIGFGYTADELCESLEWWQHSDFHNGKQDGSTRYRLSTMLETGEKIREAIDSMERVRSGEWKPATAKAPSLRPELAPVVPAPMPSKEDHEASVASRKAHRPAFTRDP